MSLTIKKVASVLSIHQLDEEDDPKASTVSRVCKSHKVRAAITRFRSPKNIKIKTKSSSRQQKGF
jgi:hypothetical protein